jgi:glycosyltransferase involved in cell wall biosynthesis
LTFIIIMACAACLILLYYFLLYTYFPNENKNDISILHSGNSPGVSVIVATKNAGDNIFHLVKKLVLQDYHTFEVIVVDDFSTDGSIDHLYTLKHPNLIILKATVDAPGKKIALSQAIFISKYPVLLFTDADCMPQSDLWIKKMVQTLLSSADKDVVLGYGPLNAQENLVVRFARYETFFTAFQYLGYAGMGLPYMGVGRNLMYKKSLFEKAGGYSGHHHIASGDDDLFIKSVATGLNVGVCTDPETFMYSDSKSNIHDFLRQKSRHITTSMHYKPIHQLLLGIHPAAHIVFYTASIIVLLFYQQWIIVLLFISIFKFEGQIFMSLKAMKMLKVSDLVISLPLMDFLFYIYYLVLPVYSIFSKNRWT